MILSNLQLPVVDGIGVDEVSSAVVVEVALPSAVVVICAVVVDVVSVAVEVVFGLEVVLVIPTVPFMKSACITVQ